MNKILAFTQIEALKFAVRYLRAENAHLKGKDAMMILSLHLLPNKSKDARSDDLFKSMATEAKTLLKVHIVCNFIFLVLIYNSVYSAIIFLF